MPQPKLILHAGAGSALDGDNSVEKVKGSLQRVTESTYELLRAGQSAEVAVLQADGQIRMSAALMNGANRSFSGVINVSRVQL
ncbi:MAG: isoaspartyl peptidase/L-asparaginase [Cyanobacteriota bacterium]